MQIHSVLVIFDRFLLTLEAEEARIGTCISEMETLAWAGLGLVGDDEKPDLPWEGISTGRWCELRS